MKIRCWTLPVRNQYIVIICLMLVLITGCMEQESPNPSQLELAEDVQVVIANLITTTLTTTVSTNIDNQSLILPANTFERKPNLSIQKPILSPNCVIQILEVNSVSYMFPVQPPTVASYIDDHHTYPATDIFAPEGSQFVAVTSGQIDELGRADLWNSNVNDPATRSGLYISLIGNDGIRYYASHLQDVVPWLKAGDCVFVGQLLGYVGRSGNARFTPPHVHFGISYPTEPGDWAIRRGLIWPYKYLKAWTNGENLTPNLSGVLDLE